MTAAKPTVLDRYCNFLDLLIALFMAIMVLMVFGNVMLHDAFNSGIAVSEELSRWFFVWLTFTGAFVALKEGSHLGTDMLVSRLMDSPTLLLLAIMVLLMAIGTAMDMTPTILIMTPVLMPVVKAAGIDPVYFGVLFIINCSIGLVTPPVGTVLNVVAGVGRMKLDEVTRGVLPFMAAQFVVMILLVLFPQLVMWPLKLFY